MCNSLDIFQDNISKFFEGFYTICAYIDNVLIINKYDFADHLTKLQKFLQKIAEVGLKLNPEKSFLRQKETDYLNLWMSKNGERTLSSKVYDIQEIDVPTEVHDIR